MRKLRMFFLRLSELWHKDRRDRELQEEMRNLVEMESAAGVAAGMNPDEARRAALMRLNPETTKEQYRAQRGLPRLESWLQDLRFGLRMLRKNPTFALVGLLTIAIGIGANTAMFSAVNSVLLHGIPFRDPGRLVMVWEKTPAVEGILGERLPVRLQSYLLWRDHSQSFDGLSAVIFNAVNVSGFEKPVRVEAGLISNNFFSVLGVNPILGRTFTADESNRQDPPRVAIISYGMYERQFGKAPDILERSIKLNGIDARVVGVLPKGFHMTAMWAGFDWPQPEVFAPLNTSGGQPLEQLLQNDLMVFGRLKPGVSVEQARIETTGLQQRLVQQYPKEYDRETTNVFSLFTEDVGTDLRRSLLVLQLTVGFVLLIACVNVANLLLVRAAAREREITVRLALGATRKRLARQMFVESLLFSTLGACTGLLLAWWGMRVVAKMAPEDVHGLHEMTLAPNVLLFTVLASLVAGLLFGLAPALHAARQYLSDRGSGRSGQGGLSRRFRAGLVVAEIALTIAPLTGAGLMIRTLHALTTLDLGIRPENVLDGSIALPESQYVKPEQLLAFDNQLLDKIRALPEVESAALSAGPPMESLSFTSFHLEGESSDRGETLEYEQVSDGYLQTMGTPLLRGRDFTYDEAEKDAEVGIVTQSLAHRLWPGQDPIGKAIIVGERHPKKRVIIGVIPDPRILALSPEARQSLYTPTRTLRNVSLIVRGRNGTAGLENVVTGQIHSLDRDLPFHHVHPLMDVLRDSVAQQRFTMFLLIAFAGLALILAMVGLYGVLSYTVAQRTREIGIRMALGAQKFDLIKTMLSQGFALVVLGVAVGIALTFLLTRAMSSLLFGVRAHDPATFVLVSVVLGLVALIACLIPARRASKVDPVVALRTE